MTPWSGQSHYCQIWSFPRSPTTWWEGTKGNEAKHSGHLNDDSDKILQTKGSKDQGLQGSMQHHVYASHMYTYIQYRYHFFLWTLSFLKIWIHFLIPDVHLCNTFYYVGFESWSYIYIYIYIYLVGSLVPLTMTTKKAPKKSTAQIRFSKTKMPSTQKPSFFFQSKCQVVGTCQLTYSEANVALLPDGHLCRERNSKQQAGWLFNMWPPLITHRFPFFLLLEAMLPCACRMVTPAPSLDLNAKVCFQGAKPLGCFNFWLLLSLLPLLLLLHYTFGWWVKQCQTCGASMCGR